MTISTDTTPNDNISGQTPDTNTLNTQSSSQRRRFLLPASDWLILLGLTLVALIPRILLATQLDLVTDEIIYIMAGKIYLPLLLHFHIYSDQWTFNYEHPPLVKLLIGLSIDLNTHLDSLLSSLLAARIPSIVFGTLLIVAIYWLGRIPFGRVIALLAALCLAVSPWLVYFSALAYLDITMTTLITLAYLLLWPALRQPRLYLLSAVLVGLAVASKYTAALAIPGMILFIAYYFLAIRPKLPAGQRGSMPWRWWLAAILLLPATFFIADPAIWRHPYSLFVQSVLFEWHHSISGHLTFLAGQYSEHVPHWAVLYILIAKLSAFVTIPAIFFVIYTCTQLVRFQLNKSNIQIAEVSSMAFLLIWLVSIVGMFSLLNIVVGTHYHLPLAPPVALAGAFGLVTLLRYLRVEKWRLSGIPIWYRRTSQHGRPQGPKNPLPSPTTTPAPTRTPGTLQSPAALVLAVLTLLLVGPHLLGLITIHAAEGYTSEFFNGENSILQVAYPGYRDAGQWLIVHTHTKGSVGLVALPDTLNHGDYSVSWYNDNRDLQGRLIFREAHPDDSSFPYDYLVWPMHLIQRGYNIPASWRIHIVHTIMGGNTIYCFILASNPATVS